MTAEPDSDWGESENERVTISFGPMPTGVRAGEQETTDVFLVDRFVTVWVEFPDGRWVREDAGALRFQIVGRTLQHHRPTNDLQDNIVVLAGDRSLTGQFRGAEYGSGKDYARYSENHSYGSWSYDEQCECSVFRRTFNITIHDDTVAEPTEELTISLVHNGRPNWRQRRDNYPLARGSDVYYAFILDDDNPKPTFTIEPVRAEITEGEPVAIRINSDKATTSNTDVHLIFSETGDTLAADGQIRYTVPLGVTEHVIYAPTVNDATRENSSTVTVFVRQLRSDTNQAYEVGPENTTTVLVEDNEVEAIPPGEPRRVSAVAGNRQVTLTWEAPIETGDDRIIRYEVQNASSPSRQWTSAGLRTSYTFTNLANDTLHIFRVRAVSDSGDGTRSDAVSATPTARTTPSIPKALAADGYDGQVILAWGKPAHNGGSPIRRYEYRYGESSVSDVAAYGGWRSTGSADTIHTVSGLTNGQSYDFQVRAANSAGQRGPVASVNNAAPRRYVQPLTVAVDSPPADHGGQEFTVTLRFNQLLLTSVETLWRGAPNPIGFEAFDYNDRTPFIRVRGGWMREIREEIEYIDIPSGLSTEEYVEQWYNQDNLVHVTIVPYSYEPVTLSVEAGSLGRTCNARAHICSGYEDHLSNSIEQSIDGPRQVSISDGSAREGTDSTVRFTLTLSEASTREVVVGWLTQDGTAISTLDYEADGGKVTFAPGETRKTISIGIRDDGLAEGAEELRVVLRTVTGAVLRDAVGVGTINDND